MKYTKIDNCGSLMIYKRPKQKPYYMKFYVGKNLIKSGYKIIVLNTTDKVYAKKIAQEKYFEFLNNKNIQSNIKYPNVNVVPQLQFSYFFEKYYNKLLTQISVGEKNKNLVRTIKSRYETKIKPLLSHLCITQVNSDEIDKVKYHLIRENLEPKTINNYLYIIEHVLKEAIKLNAISKIPLVDKVKKKNNTKDTSYKSYLNEEINLIGQTLRTIARSSPDKNHYDEIADIMFFLYFVPLRPGKEFLSLRHKDVSVISSIKNGVKEEILVIDPPHRKVGDNNHPLPSHPIAKDIYFKRILKRYPNISGEEYLFFNNEPNREMGKLQRKISKVFIKISKQLNLYYNKNSTYKKRHRPLYSIRTSNFIETYIRSGQMDLVARVGNSSDKMLKQHYLKGLDKTKVIDIYHKLYSN